MRLCLSYKYSRRILYKVVYNILAISNDKYGFCSYIVKVVGPWASRSSEHNNWSLFCGVNEYTMSWYEYKSKESKKIHVKTWWEEVNTPRSTSKASRAAAATIYCGADTTNISSSGAQLGWVVVSLTWPEPPQDSAGAAERRSSKTQQQSCSLSGLAGWSLSYLAGAAAWRTRGRRKAQQQAQVFMEVREIAESPWQQTQSYNSGVGAGDCMEESKEN